MENQILAVIIAASAAVFVIATIYYYPEVFQKLLCRIGLGMAGILGANHILSWLGIGLYVGINPLSLLVLLIMGGPGMLLLYGVEAYCKIFP
ncbi:MAG: pro-sigmaK processing inhibitor BofA family protein [Lachnospiraceae bacterium]|nr:pro-sigmaK processing inhibitor BofA family protein [Lachnospiraceae bacterium]